MWCTGRRNGRRAAVTGNPYGENRNTEDRGKLSCGAAMLIGIIVTVEIMVIGAMVFNFDYRGADMIALIFAFVVLYFGVVASLTDK